MGLRLSFGFRPLRASVPLTPRRSRRRRSSRSRAKTYHGTTHLSNGSAYTCHHDHRTEQAAIDCAARHRRQHDEATSAQARGTRQPAARGSHQPAAPPQEELRAKVRQGVANVENSRQTVEHQIAVLRDSVAKLDQHQRRALELGREDLAREASRRKLDLHSKLVDLETRYEALRREEAKLKDAATRLGAI
jgi:hypothetical protein